MKTTKTYLIENYLIKKESTLIIVEKKDHLIKRHKDWNELTRQQQDELLDYFSQKDSVPELDIDWNKLNSFDIFDIYQHSKILTKTAKKKSVKIRGIKGLKEGEDYLEFPLDDYNAFIPLTWEASKLIASKYVGACEGQWCTAYQKTSDYWNSYVQDDGVVLIYIITETTKFAIAVYPNSELTIFNAIDKSTSIRTLNEELDLDITKEIQKNNSIIIEARKIIEQQIANKYDKYLSGEIPFYDDDKNLLRTLITQNYDISKVDVSNMTDMSYLFTDSNFNNDISKWNVSNVKDMNNMFSTSKFNSDISKWNVSNVIDMSFMFYESEFNKDISQWDISKVKDMDYMFAISQFNGDISNWNVLKVGRMAYMFYDSKFNKDISKWKISKNTKVNYMFKNSPLEENPPAWYEDK